MWLFMAASAAAILAMLSFRETERSGKVRSGTRHLGPTLTTSRPSEQCGFRSLANEKGGQHRANNVPVPFWDTVRFAPLLWQLAQNGSCPEPSNNLPSGLFPIWNHPPCLFKK